MQFAFESDWPLESLGQRVRRGARQNRNCDQPRSDNTNAEEQETQLTRQRAQRFGRLGARLNVGDTVSVKDGGSIQNDEKGDHVGKGHSQVSVASHPPKLRRRLLWSALESFFAARGLLFLHFQRCLPEEEIWTNRSSKHRGQRG